MKTVEMDIFSKMKAELSELHKENEELRKRNSELEQRLNELHGEYMMLRYQFKGMPSPSEYLKLRQEMQTLKKELRDLGWKDLVKS
jgi:predicted  nucleic acid-binding Zn-ribbon protein